MADADSEAFIRKTVAWLTTCLQDVSDGLTDTIFNPESEAEARTYYAVLLLESPLCKAFERILNTLLASLSSPQPTIRSRSVKSVTQLLEIDPSILDRSVMVMNKIMRCANDSSPLVRDSALGLIAKCTLLRPGLIIRASSCIIERTTDAAKGVRRKALNLLKEMYLRNQSLEVKAAIIDAFLGRTSDVEESISDLAKQSIEDIWLSPFYAESRSGSEEARLKLKRDLQDHAALVVATAKRSDTTIDMLTALFRDSLSGKSKSPSSNRGVCKALVEILFEWIIDNDDSAETPSQKNCLLTLTVFARAEPKLFDSQQMMTLRPYIENLATSEDLQIYRAVVVIYRRVLPVLPPLQRNFLFEVQDVLFKTVQKLGKFELDEVTQCLWIIDGVLHNTERLAKLMASVLRGIMASAGKDLAHGKPESVRLTKYMSLAGYFGRSCNLEQQKALFKQTFPSKTFGSVSELIVDVLLQFTGEDSDLSIRECALESLCLVCESWPKGYQNPRASAAFRYALDDGEPALKSVILTGVRNFYVEEEVKAKSSTAEEQGSKAESLSSTARLHKSMVTSDNDGASTAIAHQFLPHILDAALGKLHDLALVATEIIGSISRQGLVHPKEIGYALVALETSAVPEIAKMALDEHRDMHSKHESMLDKEYQKALERTFAYCRDISNDVSGVDSEGNPKLGPFYEVLKTGSLASRKKLFNGVCTRLNSDLARISNNDDVVMHVLYARFVLNNFGTFSYSRTDELSALVTGLEKIFTTTGNAIAQQIELLYGVGQSLQGHTNGVETEDALTRPAINVEKLRPLAASATVMCMLWETRTHLRRAWNMQANSSSKAKAAAKDGSKTLVRVSSVSSDEFLSRLTQMSMWLESQDKMEEGCRAFLAIHSTDHDEKQDTDEDLGDDWARPSTPSEHGTETSSRGSMAPVEGRKKGRASKSATPAQTPSKRARPPGSARRSSKTMKINDGHDQEYEYWD